MEHYCTLFDLNYLPLGMALHESLRKNAGDFQLWILCMDPEVHEALQTLHLPHTRLIRIAEMEEHFPPLTRVRSTRSRGEFCWTTTPFLPELVFRLDPSVQRATYLDADLYFFGSPRPILEEFDRSEAHVLITEHSYTEDADYTNDAGRFNVQFLPFRRTEKALEILRWWQTQCVDCCTKDTTSGSYGDQKYLDEWPRLFGDAVHIHQAPELTLGPWNVRHLWKGGLPKGSYHFSGLRIFLGGETRLYSESQTVLIPFRVLRGIYRPYVRSLRRAWARCATAGIAMRPPPAPRKSLFLLRRVYHTLLRIQCWSRLDRSPWLSFQGWSPFDR